MGDYRANKERQRIRRFNESQEELNEVDDLRREVKRLQDEVLRLAARQDSVYSKADRAEMAVFAFKDRLDAFEARVDEAMKFIQRHLRRSRH